MKKLLFFLLVLICSPSGTLQASTLRATPHCSLANSLEEAFKQRKPLQGGRKKYRGYFAQTSLPRCRWNIHDWKALMWGCLTVPVLVLMGAVIVFVADLLAFFGVLALYLLLLEIPLSALLVVILKFTAKRWWASRNSHCPPGA